MASAPPVDPGYALWLKARSRRAAATVAGAQLAWGDDAVDSEVMSPIAYQADAQAVAVQQAQFLAGPLARDRITVAGLHSGLVGYVVRIFGDRLGYEVGSEVYVIAAEEGQGPRVTTLTVLKRL